MIPVRVTLSDLPGDLEILTAPNAEVMLDGKAAGVATDSGRLVLRGLKPIEHKLRVVRDGYNPSEAMVTINPSALVSMTVPLKAIATGPGGFSVRAPRYVLQSRLVAYPEGVEGAFFIPNSDELVSWGEYDGVIVWDRRTGRQLRTIELREKRSLAQYFLVSPDLRWLTMRALGGAHPTRLVDARTGRIVREFSGVGYPRAFTVDSKRIVVGAHLGYSNAGPDDEAALFDVETGREIKGWKDLSMRAFAISPDGKWIAGGDYYVALWDAQTGKQVRRIVEARDERLGKARTLAFSADSRYLAFGNEKEIELWEPASGLLGRTIEAPKSAAGETQGFRSLAFIPDSPYLISVLDTSGSNAQRIYLWDLQTGRSVADWPVERVGGIVLSGDGEWMALTGQDLTLWHRQ
jgi:WD40 repeat protein